MTTDRRQQSLIALGAATRFATGILMGTGLATLPDVHVVRLLVAGTGFVVIAAAFPAMTTGALAFIGDVAPTGNRN